MIDEYADGEMGEEKRWVPSPSLRQRLWVNSWLTLATGALYAASSIAVLIDGNTVGFTVADGFAWAALLPALYIVFTFSALAHELGITSLAKSAQCLFLATVLLRLYKLGTANVLDLFGEIVVWVVFVSGMVGLLFMPFLSGEEKATAPNTADNKPKDKSKAAEVTASGASKAGALGAVVIGILALFKFLGKFMVKVAIFRGIAQFLQNLAWKMIAGGMAIFLGSVFMVWFAVAKIRLAKRLGGFASLLGWFEIFRLMVLLGCGVMFTVQLSEAHQPGVNDKAADELHAHLIHEYAVIELISDLVWTALTVCFFLTIRNRFDTDVAQHDDWRSNDP